MHTTVVCQRRSSGRRQVQVEIATINERSCYTNKRRVFDPPPIRATLDIETVLGGYIGIVVYC